MMNRKFTAREAWLLLLLSVMLLALFYYLALYRPVNLEVERCAALQVPVEEDLELQMMKATRKKKMVDELENAPEKQQGELLPYNNIKNEITDLYEALSPAATYNLSFSEAVASGNIVRRDISISFQTENYQKMRSILEQMHSSPYRCILKDLSISVNKSRGEAGGMSAAELINEMCIRDRHIIVQRFSRHRQRPGHGQPRPQQRGHGIGKLAGSIQHADFPQNGNLQLQPVPFHPAPVSYTHLDVYKRQVVTHGGGHTVLPVNRPTKVQGFVLVEMFRVGKLTVSLEGPAPLLPVEHGVDSAGLPVVLNHIAPAVVLHQSGRKGGVVHPQKGAVTVAEGVGVRLLPLSVHIVRRYHGFVHLLSVRTLRLRHGQFSAQL